MWHALYIFIFLIFFGEDISLKMLMCKGILYFQVIFVFHKKSVFHERCCLLGELRVLSSALLAEPKVLWQSDIFQNKDWH